MIKFSIFTHYCTVGKHFSLVNGQLTNTTNGMLFNALVSTESVEQLQDLVSILEQVTPNQHLTAGICQHDQTRCVPQSDLVDDLVSRDNKSFPFPDNGSAGIMLIDSDSITASVIDQLIAAVPAMASFARIETTSSSSNISSSDGTLLRGIRGTHIYFAVSSPVDIPRAMDVLHKRLILSGHANHQVSNAGTFLERSAVDKALISPSQPIYVKPTLSDGLTQEKTIQYFDGLPLIDTENVIIDLTEEEELTYKSMIDYGRFSLANECERIREQWIDKQPDRRTAGKALDDRVLSGDFIIHTQKGDLTIREILANREHYHGTTCKDPIEPDYSGYTVAKIYSDQDVPVINSQAHGGHTLRLERTVAEKFESQAIGEHLPPPTQLAVVPDYNIEQPISGTEWHSQQLSNMNKLEPASTLWNFKRMMQLYGIHIGYDVVSKNAVVSGLPVKHNSDLRENALHSHIYSLCNLNKINTGSIDHYMTSMMEENEVNPVAQWIGMREWDGQDRIDELFNTLTLAPDQDRKIAYLMFRKWLIGAVKIVQRKIDHFEFVLVIQNETGGEGKTAWFNKLCPDIWVKDGMSLDPSDKDSVKQAISYWITELGELDSLFRKSDVKRLMAFLSNSNDEIRLPYGKTYNKYQRRTAFCGSVNKREFLMDDSGDRRFWPISITSINYEHTIDMQQLWAQVDKLDERHWLDHTENALIIEHNIDFKTADPIDDVMCDYFNRPPAQQGTQVLNATAILKLVGIERPTKSQATKAATWLRKHNYNFERKSTGKGYAIPIISMFGH